MGNLATSSTLQGRRGVVFGLANQRSLAFEIARRFSAAGAQTTVTYQNERFEAFARDAKDQCSFEQVLPCDVRADGALESCADTVLAGGPVDFLVHSLAFASSDSIQNAFTDVSREAFSECMEISVHSLVRMSGLFADALAASNQGCILTLSYLGANRVVPGYHLMGAAKAALESSVRSLAHELGPRGIRVNAISARPLRTLSSRALPDFQAMNAYVDSRAPLGGVDADSVAGLAEALLTDACRSVTGQTLYADGGFHTLAAQPER